MDHNDNTNDALFQRFKRGDREAREKLVLENLPLVKHVAARFSMDLSQADDLFQEGCIGLLKALENFDPERGTKFSTYAVPFILGEMRAFLRRSGHLMKVSRSYHEHCRILHKTVEELEQKMGRKPRLEELVKALEIPKEEIVWLMDLNRPPVALDDDEGFAITEMTGENDFASDAHLQGMMLMERVKNLPQRERQIMVLRYFMEKTQEETASLMGLSQAHVSRIERKILQQMKEESPHK